MFRQSLSLAGRQTEAGRLFDKIGNRIRLFQLQTIGHSSASTRLQPVALILSSAGACLKTQGTSDSVSDAGSVKRGEVTPFLKAAELIESCHLWLGR